MNRQRTPWTLAGPSSSAALARGLSIVEVTVALVILAVVTLGSVKALEGSAQLQRVTKERQAASLAATAQLNDLVMLGSVDETGWDNISNFNGTGFPVTLQAGVVGASADFSSATTTATGTLPAAPANSTLWPTSRTGASSTVQSQAGYIEVVSVAGRDGLKQITVSVAWRGVGNSVESIYLTQLVVNPEF